MYEKNNDQKQDEDLQEISDDELIEEEEDEFDLDDEDLIDEEEEEKQNLMIINFLLNKNTVKL